MPKTRLCKDSTNQPDNDDIFSDFEPPNTTDGSYRGTMKKVKATETHLQRKFEEKLEEVKVRLKAGKCKVGLKVSGGSIQLQATLPPKPDSDKVKPHQQLISLGIPANLDGLKTAEEEAYALGTLLARKQFEWNEKYLGTKQEEVNVLTIGELLERFEEEYFKTRPITEKSKVTFSRHYGLIKNHMPLELTLTLEVINEILNKNINKSATQSRILVALKVFCKTFKVDFDFKQVKKIQYNPKERNIPSDNKIIECFYLYKEHSKLTNGVRKEYKNNWLFWQWVYGMMATYGLRPRELFLKPNIEWWLSPENTDNTWKVHKDCKTGERECFPLYLEWVELFDLKNTTILNTLDQKTNDLNIYALEDMVGQNSYWFKRYLKLGFQPYDLRHAWAIRAHMLGIPIKAAADNLGHSVEIHTSTYQKWFGRDNRKRAINEAINKKSETELIKDELNQARLEIEQLKLENERIKLELQYAKINS